MTKGFFDLVKIMLPGAVFGLAMYLKGVAETMEYMSSRHIKDEKGKEK